MDQSVILEKVSKQYGKVAVLDNMDLEIARGELLVLLGPSGCGKTTTLRLIAGLEQLDGGSISISGRDVSRLPLRKRGVGMVFQAYSLFPHMNAADNVAYGLKVRGAKKSLRLERAHEMLDLVGLADSAAKFPNQMSGGQQQRVALARALVLEPAVLLLDEPLSALDAKVRSRLRTEIRAIHERAGTTTVMVSHDQEEALTMGDRIAVMSRGEILQLGTPADVYMKPSSLFVSEFIGSVNRVPARRVGDEVSFWGRNLSVVNSDIETGQDVVAHVRPENIQIGTSGEGNGTISKVVLLGSMTSLVILMDGSPEALRVDVPTPRAANLAVAQRVLVSLEQDRVLVDNL